MIELLTGLLICWICNTLEKERKTLKRIRDAKEKLFSDDRIKYENV
ncbi:hypothetical protein UFOVP207_17 [uncultured Caudovirales phage]|uniref:Uncharacterized protein n=1 Tax=uncultured Caudovirales phage TaxID=2100421 RepID=A0A6J7WIX4_9CAUD|nr:hypothetical protein UFOVP207_17 [uncultured Caudovirales phage]